MLKNAVFFLLASVLALIMAPSVYAAEVGNLYQSDGGTLKLELKSDHQTRDVELDSAFIIYDESEVWGLGEKRTYTTITDLKAEEVSDRRYLKASFAPTSDLEVYAKLGAGSLKTKMYSSTQIKTYDYFDGADNLVSRDYDGALDPYLSGGMGDGIMYGIGVKSVLHQSGTFQVGLDAQYQYQEGDGFVIENTTAYDEDAGVPQSLTVMKNEIEESRTSEMHLALIASKKMAGFTPYGGVKLSLYKTEYEGKWTNTKTDYITSNLSTSESYDTSFSTKQKNSVGIFVGADYSFTESFGVNAEVRLGDEAGFTTGLCYLF